MRRTVAVSLALLMGFQPLAGLAAQDPAKPPPVEALGVSFDRIKRELGERPPSPAIAPLKLDYYVEVIGWAPQIQLFTPEELRAGPVPGGPPTHWEMVDQVFTKPEFKAPAVPISSLAIMGIAKLVQWQANQVKKRRAEEARQKELDELRKKYPDLVVK